MNQFLTREQVRALDRRAIDEQGVPGVVLMENAGRGVAELIRRERSVAGLDVRVVCGAGQNGGDGFVIARHLAGAPPTLTDQHLECRRLLAGAQILPLQVLDEHQKIRLVLSGVANDGWNGLPLQLAGGGQAAVACDQLVVLARVAHDNRL